MLLVHSAIPDVPTYARLPAHPLAVAASQLQDEHGAYSSRGVSEAFRLCEAEQPELVRWLNRKLEGRQDDAARGLGAAMAMTIWLGFRFFARDRLGIVRENDCTAVEALVRADLELRREDPKAVLESDDIIAAHQPEVAKQVRAHVDEILAKFAEGIDIDEVDAVYQVLLIQVLALSYAIKLPRGGLGTQTSGLC